VSLHSKMIQYYITVSFFMEDFSFHIKPSLWWFWEIIYNLEKKNHENSLRKNLYLLIILNTTVFQNRKIFSPSWHFFEYTFILRSTISLPVLIFPLSNILLCFMAFSDKKKYRIRYKLLRISAAICLCYKIHYTLRFNKYFTLALNLDPTPPSSGP